MTNTSRVPALSFHSLLILVVLTSANAHAEDWYRWRGPRLDGISRESQWSTSWQKTPPRVRWRHQLGTGFSSIVTAHGKVYSAGNNGERDTIFCLDEKTGKEVWKYSYESALDDHFFEGGPTSTPTIDQSFVYFLARRGKLVCLHRDTGEEIWSRNLADEEELRVSAWGFSGSPLVHKHLLILNAGEAGLAVDKETGKTIWKSADREAGFSTPFPYQHNGTWCGIIGSARFFIGVELETGKELWRERWLTRFGCNAADPLVDGNRFLISSGYNRGAGLFEWTGDGVNSIWKNKDLQTQFQCGILIDGHVYALDGDTTSARYLKCVEYSTGKVKWSLEGFGSGGLCAAGNRLLLLAEDGTLHVLRAQTDKPEPLGKYPALQEKCWTAPVISNGCVYCRSAAGELVCLQLPSEE